MEETSTLQSGTVLAGRYRVCGRLGAGGMGAVFEAENLHTGRRVAVKVLAAAAEGARRRFAREARAASRLVHPNIVDVLDMEPAPAGGSPFLVQELLVGEDLRAFLRARGRVPPAEALRIVRPLLDALAFAHERGVVHRDIKPENVFLARDERGEVVPKIIDFGIASLADATPDGSKLTQTGALIGTPLYMSPEQARGDDEVDGRADVWSVGVVLYELLCGETPFGAESMRKVLGALLVKPVPPLRDRNPAVPADLAAVVHLALSRDVSARPTARALSASLAALSPAHASAEGSSAPPVAAATEAPRAASSDTREVVAAVFPQAPRARRWAAAGATLLLAAVAGWWLRPRAPAPPVPVTRVEPPPSPRTALAAPSPPAAPAPAVADASTPPARPHGSQRVRRDAPRPSAPSAPSARPGANGAAIVGL